jgi:hypothetical protein
VQRALFSVERARLRESESATETFDVDLPIPGKQVPPPATRPAAASVGLLKEAPKLHPAKPRE